MSFFQSKVQQFFRDNNKKNTTIRISLFLIASISIILKGIIFQGFVANDNPYYFNLLNGFNNVSAISLCYYIAFALFFFSFSLLFRGKGIYIYIFIINIIITALFLTDIWYYRGFNTVPSMLILTQTSNLDNMWDAISSMISIYDLLFLIDFIILIIYIVANKNSFLNNHKRLFKSFMLTCILPLIFIVYLPFNLYVLHNYNINTAYVLAGTEPNYTYNYLSTVGYHIFDAITVYYDTKPYNLTNQDKENIDELFKTKNENLPNNNYFAAAKGKNLIYIQVESLETFVINKTINNKEITPNLNKLIKKSVYFPNTFEQVGEGTSADCDFIANTGLLPVRRGCTFFRYPNNNYNSLPKILSNNGYSTSVIHSDKGSFWNYELALSGGIGFDKFTDYFSFEHDDMIGMGLSDESYFKQILPMIKELKSPFYAMTITLTSHAPFSLPDEHRQLDLDSELNENRLGGYFESIHYTDEQLGKFLDSLEKEGLLENSIIAIMGDHTGVHKYYNDDISQLSNPEEWYLDKGGRKVPVIIYDPSNNIEPKSFDTLINGQIDLMPTMLYLLGIPKEKYENTCVGRNILNTNKSFAIIHDGRLMSDNNLTDEEKNILLKSNEISDKMIRSNYIYK